MLFGVCALLAVGASWCVVGIVFEDAPRRGVQTGLLQFVNSALSVLLSSAIFCCFLNLSDSGSLPLVLLTCGTYALSGIFNFCALQAMGAGMKCGPAGIVWAIMQSALIFPFLCGIILFGQTLTVPGLFGFLLLCSALIFFAQTKNRENNPKASGPWLFYAFLALSIIAVQQCLATLPSYFPEARTVSPVLRSLGMSGGVLIAAAGNILIQRLRGSIRFPDFFAGLRNHWVYAYSIVMQCFFLFFAYLFLYPGLDAMTNAGAGSLSYPLMVGSCISVFSIYSLIRLKEKLTGIQIAALGLCLAGLAGLCFPNTILSLPIRFWNLVPTIRSLLQQ